MLAKELEVWLRSFSRAVRERDFGSGKKLFTRKVVAFGTACDRADGLRELTNRQWAVIWPNTTGFEFDYKNAQAFRHADQAVIIAGWKSRSLNGNGNGLGFQRRGRATIILRKKRSGWQAVHSHFSLNPVLKK